MRTYLPSFSRLCFVFAWMVCMTPAVLAQSVNVDLIESLRLAKAHDPQYAAAQAQRDQSLIKREQMAPLWDAQTQAMVTAGMGGQDLHVTQARAMGQNGVGFDSSISAGALARVGVTTQKPIRNPALDVQSQMLDIGARIGEVQWAQAQQDLRWRVVQRDFDVLSAQQSLEVLQRQSGTLIKAGDLSVMIAGPALTSAPTITDRLIIDGVLRTIVSVSPSYVAEQVAMWQVQAR